MSQKFKKALERWRSDQITKVKAFVSIVPTCSNRQSGDSTFFSNWRTVIWDKRNAMFRDFQDFCKLWSSDINAIDGSELRQFQDDLDYAVACSDLSKL